MLLTSETPKVAVVSETSTFASTVSSGELAKSYIGLLSNCQIWTTKRRAPFTWSKKVLDKKQQLQFTNNGKLKTIVPESCDLLRYARRARSGPKPSETTY